MAPFPRDRMIASGAIGSGSFAPEQILTEYWEVRDLAQADGSIIDLLPGRNGQYDLSQTGSMRPTYVENVGGYPAARFNTSHALESIGQGLGASLADGAAVSFFWIVRNGESTNTRFGALVAQGGATTVDPYQFYVWPNGSGSDRNYQQRDDAGSNSINHSWNVGSGISDAVGIITFGGYGGDLNVWTNGTQYVSGVTATVGGVAPLDRFAIGVLNRGGTYALYFIGDVHALGVLVGGELTADQRTLLEDYSLQEFGL